MTARTKARLMAAAGVVLVIAVLGWVGHMDYQDAVMEQKHYCIMVERGAWPDFRHIYEDVCHGN